MARELTFGSVLVAHQERYGLTQKAVADALGANRWRVHRWEQGVEVPHAPAAKRIIELCELSADDVAALIVPAGSASQGSFGHQLRVRRHLAGLTSRMLADRVDVIPLTVSRWEGEWTVPGPGALPAISDVLDWDLDELLAACPPNRNRGRPRRHAIEDRAQWAADAREEAARGRGVYRRLRERWGVDNAVVIDRLRFMREAGYIDSVETMRKAATERP